jgi:hypothetical protein
MTKGEETGRVYYKDRGIKPGGPDGSWRAAAQGFAIAVAQIVILGMLLDFGFRWRTGPNDVPVNRRQQRQHAMITPYGAARSTSPLANEGTILRASANPFKSRCTLRVRVRARQRLAACWFET